MAHRNFSMIEYFNRRCGEVEPRLTFSGKGRQEWQAWRTALLGELADAARQAQAAYQAAAGQALAETAESRRTPALRMDGFDRIY